jgi:isopentenyl-diphosphate delta-isomerase
VAAGWEDIIPVHQALPKYYRDQIDTGVELFGKRIALPLLINAITGGAEGLEKINSSLAVAARELGIGMAVGSQTAAVYKKGLSHTFSIARRLYPRGLIMANVSALAGVRAALEAIEMVEADVLQLHLNSVQELIMPEGDRDFRHTEENISRIVAESPVPVLVKEVGFGISGETSLRLFELGVQGIDAGGAGGTNFAGIELARNPEKGKDYLRQWGIPAAISLLEVLEQKLPLTVIASGGITNAPELFKALALGANAAAMAGTLLHTLVKEGEKALITQMQGIQAQLKNLILLTGEGSARRLIHVPLTITGFTREWCEQRGIDTKSYAMRKTNRR